MTPDDRALWKHLFGFRSLDQLLPMIRQLAAGSRPVRAELVENALGVNLGSDEAREKLARVETIILTLAPEERADPARLLGEAALERRRAVADASVTSLAEVDRLLGAVTAMQRVLDSV